MNRNKNSFIAQFATIDDPIMLKHGNDPEDQYRDYASENFREQIPNRDAAPAMSTLAVIDEVPEHGDELIPMKFVPTIITAGTFLRRKL